MSQNKQKTCLGNETYVELSENELFITNENNGEELNCIVLDSAMLEALLEFLEIETIFE